MKKIDLEKIQKGLFGQFESNRLSYVTSCKVTGGTSTALCKTVEDPFDHDSQSSQENTSDPRCQSYHSIAF